MGNLLAKSISTDARVDGKTIVITGSNIGIGLETAAYLYGKGGRIILACRDMMRAEMAKKEILARYLGYDGAGYLSLVRCDLSSLTSVRACANEILKNEERIDIVINNAGVMMTDFQLSADGYELQLATNHLGHFLMTMLLLPRILRGAQNKSSTDPSRIVNLSSVAHRFASDMFFEDINMRNNYEPFRAYSRSKAANVLFTKALASKLEGKNVRVYAVHPGIVDTPLWKHSHNIVPGLPCLMKNVASYFIKTPLQGAQTTLHCALTQEAANESGLYYNECKKETPSSFVRSKEVADKLFDISVEMVRLDFKNKDPFMAEDGNNLVNGIALHSL